jgi:hypothetical protein
MEMKKGRPIAFRLAVRAFFAAFAFFKFLATLFEHAFAKLTGGGTGALAQLAQQAGGGQGVRHG